MAILMKPGKVTRALDGRGMNIILDRDSGVIDWLPEESELFLLRRGAAERVRAKKKAAPAPHPQPKKPDKAPPPKKGKSAKKAAAEPADELTDDEIMELAGELGIDCNAYDGDPEGLREAVLTARAGAEAGE